MKACPRCAWMLADSDVVCPRCGIAMGVGPGVPPGVPVPHTPPVPMPPPTGAFGPPPLSAPLQGHPVAPPIAHGAPPPAMSPPGPYGYPQPAVAPHDGYPPVPGPIGAVSGPPRSGPIPPDTTGPMPPPPYQMAPPLPVPPAPPSAPAADVAAGPRLLVGFLVTFQTDPNGAFWPIRSGRTSVARAEPGTTAEIAVTDASMSSRHALLIADPETGQAFVEDERSRNGTFVNEQRVNAGERRMLRDGDRLRLGSTTFVVKLLVA